MASNVESENLTICLPGDRCNKHCPYCVSKMTPTFEEVSDSGFDAWMNNLKKVKYIASSAGIGSILITGKGEPSLRLWSDSTEDICNIFQEFPIEIQVNDIEIVKNHEKIIRRLSFLGINTVAVSVDCLKYDLVTAISRLQKAFILSSSVGMNNRISINVTNHTDIPHDLFEFFETLKSLKVDQVLLRNVIFPEDGEDSETKRWIKENTSFGKYEIFEKKISDFIIDNNFKKIRTTKWGMNIYDVMGISYAMASECIQESAEFNHIRSLIYQQDAHLYTSWNSKASRLF